MRGFGPICDPHIIELAEKIEPYMESRDDKSCLRKDAPPDVVEAYEELMRFFWEDPIQ